MGAFTVRRLVAGCAAAALLAGCAAPGGDDAAGPADALSAPQALRAAATALLAVPAPRASASLESAPEGPVLEGPVVSGPVVNGADAPGATPADLLPGLYALDRLAIDVNGTTVTIRAQRPCAEVLDELRAGQWTARVIPAADSPLAMTMALLSYGEHLAMVYLKDSAAACVGTVTAASQVDVTGGGAVTAAGAGVELPLYCHVGPNLDGDDLKDLVLSYFGLFTTASGAFVAMASGPATTGSHTLTVDEEGSQGVTILPLKPGTVPIDAAVTFLSTFFAGQGDPETAFSQFTGMFAGGGTLDVTSSSPLEATLTTDTLAAYDDDADDDDDESDDSGYDSDGNPIDGSEGDDEAGGGVMQEIGGAAGQTLTLTAPLHCGQ